MNVFHGLKTAVLAVALAACASAQAPPGHFPVQGVVIDSVTHQPIARALVQAQDDATLTDSDGRFSLSLARGVFQLLVRRPGYQEGPFNRRHSIEVGPDTPELTLTLRPLAAIEGRVTLPTDGNAFAPMLQLFRKQLLNGHARWVQAGMTQMREDGSFKFPQLEAPGSYMVCTQSGAVERFSSSKPTLGYAPACFPGATDLASATPLSLLPGQHMPVDIELARQPLYPVTFAVAGVGTTPNTIVMINNRSGTAMAPRRRSENGSTEYWLPTGTYTAEASTPFNGRRAFGRTEFTVAGAPLYGVHLTVLPVQPIPVEIHREFTRASTTPQGNVRGGGTNSPGLYLSLLSAGAYPMGGGMWGGLRHKQGGGDQEFELEATPGTYQVHSQAFQGYISSITCGGVDLSREPLVVGPGGSSAPIQITVRDDSGSIQAQIAGNGASSGFAYVYALPLFPSTEGIRQSAAALPHPVTLPNLAPGSYRVVAFDHTQDFDLDNPEKLAALTRDGKTVTVEAGGTATVQLELTTTDTAEGDQ